jgi:hypothetical protein
VIMVFLIIICGHSADNCSHWLLPCGADNDGPRALDHARLWSPFVCLSLPTLPRLFTRLFLEQFLGHAHLLCELLGLYIPLLDLLSKSGAELGQVRHVTEKQSEKERGTVIE